MTLAADTKLGPYQIQTLVGVGGMGEVYRARDLRLERDVAIKVLPVSLASDQERLRRFEHEARAVAALNHPNLLTVFDVGSAAIAPAENSGETAAAAASPYIVSELLEGSTLRERLLEGALPQRKALEYAVQIARGLAAAHERGIVHRDIKPENLFLTNDGRIKILDFGLAKLTEAVAARGDATRDLATELGVVLGTVGYMSPEQVRAKPLDARTDIFSFGAVLYEMLSGRRAFQGETPADVMSAILNHEPPELTAAKQEIPPALDHIVHHCMEKNPQQRFQSAGDIAFQLGELSGMRTSAASPALGGGGRTRKISARILAATGAIAVALLLAAIWFLARATAHSEPPTYSQLSFQQGYVDSARILPDGQSYICAARWGTDTASALYTGRFDSQGLRPLGIDADSILSASREGELLVLQKAHPVGPGYVRVGTLAKMDLGGGAPRAVLDSVQYADWTPAGKDFAVVRFIPEKRTYRLEYPVGNVLYETAGWISDPRFSRDGKRIAFLDHPVFGDDMGGAAVVDLQGRRKMVSRLFGSTQGLTWSPDGDEIWFSAVNGVFRSIYAATPGGRERHLLSAPGNVDIQDALPDGRVLVNNLTSRRTLMVFTPEYPHGRDFTWMDWAYGARFSLDAKKILFGDQHSGALYGTFLRDLDGSPAVRLGDGDPMDISYDGKWAVSRLPVAPDQLLLLPTGTGNARQLTSGDIDYTSALWAPGDQIIAVGNEPNHDLRTYLIDLSGKVTPITPEGVPVIAVSTDGKKLLTSNLDFTSYHLMSFPGGSLQPLPQLLAGDFPLDFSLDDKSILVRRNPGGPAAEIWRVDLADGKRTLLHTIALPAVSAIATAIGISVSRDGKSYAYQFHPAESTEYLVEGLR